MVAPDFRRYVASGQKAETEVSNERRKAREEKRLAAGKNDPKGGRGGEPEK